VLESLSLVMEVGAMAEDEEVEEGDAVEGLPRPARWRRFENVPVLVSVAESGASFGVGWVGGENVRRTVSHPMRGGRGREAGTEREEAAERAASSSAPSVGVREELSNEEPVGLIASREVG
jgi:hypothetical protein